MEFRFKVIEAEIGIGRKSFVFDFAPPVNWRASDLHIRGPDNRPWFVSRSLRIRPDRAGRSRLRFRCAVCVSAAAVGRRRRWKPLWEFNVFLSAKLGYSFMKRLQERQRVFRIRKTRLTYPLKTPSEQNFLFNSSRGIGIFQRRSQTSPRQATKNRTRRA